MASIGSERALTEAAAHIATGGIVVHATEGVWGFACDPFSESAVRRLLAIKQRSADKGLIVIGADTAQLEPELEGLEQTVRQRLCDSWPGPVSWVVPNVRFAPWVTGVHATVAVRVPGHPQARALAALAERPLISTSANLSGAPAVLTETQARAQFVALVDQVLEGAVQSPGVPSQLRRLDGERLR